MKNRIIENCRRPQYRGTTFSSTCHYDDDDDDDDDEEDNRHVRFGGVEDVYREMEKRVSLEKEQNAIGKFTISSHII